MPMQTAIKETNTLKDNWRRNGAIRPAVFQSPQTWIKQRHSKSERTISYQFAQQLLLGHSNYFTRCSANC